jgi:hypothetical protein
MTQPNNYVLGGGGFQSSWRIIGQKFFFKADINFIRQFFTAISKSQFESSEAMRILNIRHVISKQ